MDTFPPDNLARQFDFAYIAAISEALENMYGTRGGRGMALRIGRASFAQGMKSFGAFAGMNTPAFKTLPLDQQVQLGVQVLVSVFNKFSDQDTTLQDKGDFYQIEIANSPMVWGRTTDRPACHALVGISQEAMRWASVGHEFHVQEIACRATGSEQCVFKVNKRPIGQG
jgi:predicted hydrocarbon binding protein